MALYLKEFALASASDEESFVLKFPYQLEMGCYSKDVYPFKIFPQKEFKDISFEPITIFYGGNGSGKSTLLNVICEKVFLLRSSPWNKTPYFEEYLKYCSYEGEIPRDGRMISSDDVFDFLLDVRAINDGVDHYREDLFEEYKEAKKTHFQLESLDDYAEFKRHNEAKRSTKSVYTTKRLPKELSCKSNGESAFSYFTNEIKEDSLYLLDEPENSLSPKLQIELAAFLADSARFYGCQFIIATHSPFLLSIKNAKIYDLDSIPVRTKPWTMLENVRVYYDFFHQHRDKFS